MDHPHKDCGFRGILTKVVSIKVCNGQISVQFGSDRVIVVSSVPV